MKGATGKGRTAWGIFALAFLLPLGACFEDQCDRSLDDRARREMAKGMSLEEMYAFHVSTTKACEPPNTVLSWEVAGFGEPAKALALSRMQSGDVGDFDAALAVIGSYNARYDKECSVQDYNRMVARADRLSTMAPLRKDVMASCFRRKTPS